MNSRVSRISGIGAAALCAALTAVPASAQLLTPGGAAAIGACLHLNTFVACPPGLPPGSFSLIFLPGGTNWQSSTGGTAFVPLMMFPPFVPPAVPTPTPPPVTPTPTPTPMPVPPVTSTPPPPVTAPPTPPAVVGGGVRISENQTPTPRDRIFFFHESFPASGLSPTTSPTTTPPTIRPEQAFIPVPVVGSAPDGSDALFGAGTQNFNGPGRNDIAIALADDVVPGPPPRQAAEFSLDIGTQQMLEDHVPGFGSPPPAAQLPQVIDGLFVVTGPADALPSLEPFSVSGVYNDRQGIGFQDLLIDGPSPPPGQAPEPFFITLPGSLGFEPVRGAGPEIGGSIIAGNTAGTPPTLGDFDGDGSVGAADYVIWRETQGSSTDLRADASGDGVVDAADYDLWRSHFGTSNGAPGNAATAQGGGVFVQDGRVALADTAVQGNTAGAGAGAGDSGPPGIGNSTIFGNTPGASPPPGEGGGVFVGSGSSLPNSTISGNTAGSGGGIFNDGKVTLSNSTISGNTAGSGGGETAQQDEGAAFVKKQAASIVRRLTTGTPEERARAQENLDTFANDEVKAAVKAGLEQHRADSASRSLRSARAQTDAAHSSTPSADGFRLRPKPAASPPR